MSTLLIPSKLINITTKQLIKDLKTILSCKSETSFNNRKSLETLKELVDINDEVSLFFFETIKKKKSRLNYLWISHKNSITIKLAIDQIMTMRMIRSIENSSKNKNFIVIFSSDFDENQSLKLFKELIIKIFGDNKEECERVLAFHFYNGIIYFRHYKVEFKNNENEVKEMGPRFSLKIEKILNGYFKGERLDKD
ncbi:Ribosome biogenesis protein BRX1 like protein 1 [Dictyocoela muelleri]|nr:Ribosome biogenesis protein BRX1 like protein 1 [Dictyocoela muelleri]